MKFYPATFNVRGLSKDIKQDELKQDMELYSIDICSLQETKIKEDKDIKVGNHRLITFAAECEHYGTGFMLSPKWADKIHGGGGIIFSLCINVLNTVIKVIFVTSQINIL